MICNVLQAVRFVWQQVLSRITGDCMWHQIHNLYQLFSNIQIIPNNRMKRYFSVCILWLLASFCVFLHWPFCGSLPLYIFVHVWSSAAKTSQQRKVPFDVTSLQKYGAENLHNLGFVSVLFFKFSRWFLFYLIIAKHCRKMEAWTYVTNQIACISAVPLFETVKTTSKWF